MKCPYCGEAMEAGDLFHDARTFLSWLPRSAKMPHFRTWGAVKKKGGVTLNYADPMGYRPGRVTAHVCRTCGKGVFNAIELRSGWL